MVLAFFYSFYPLVQMNLTIFLKSNSSLTEITDSHWKLLGSKAVKQNIYEVILTFHALMIAI